MLPKAMAVTAPSEAPEETPSVDPSASGFFNSPCMAAPEIESVAPVRKVHRTLGSLTVRMIDANGSPAVDLPDKAFARILAVSAKGTLTLPMHTQRISTAIKSADRSRYKVAEREDLCFISPVKTCGRYDGCRFYGWLVTKSLSILAPSVRRGPGRESSLPLKFNMA